MKCYIVYTGYEEFRLSETLKEAISIRRKNYDNAANAFNSSNISFEDSDGNREDVDLRPFIKKIGLTLAQIKEIDDKIEQETEKTEERLKTMFAGMNPGAMITGDLGITRDRKEWAIQNEIKNASFVWDEEEIDKLD